MADVTELLKTVKKAAIQAVKNEKPVEVCFGKVIRAEPIKISVDSKLILGQAQLILTRNVTEHKIEMTVEHSTEAALEMDISHSHSYSGKTEEGGEPAHEHSYSGETENIIFKNLSHAHEYVGRKIFIVHKGLVEGENVLMIRQQGGQKYIVVDRV